VEQVIESYQPAVKPPAGELKRVVVVIDPAGGGSPDGRRRRCDDLALQTAGHLYHLVRRAGGVAVMTRADDRAAPPAGAGSVEGLKALCAQKKADLIVTIRFDCSGREQTGGVCAPAADAPSEPLARALAKELNVPVLMRTGWPVPSPGVPWAEVSQADPGDGLSLLERQAFPRPVAVAIYRGIVAFVGARQAGSRPAAGDPNGADKPDDESVPRYPDPDPSARLVQTARTIWPDGLLPPEKAGWFCGLFRRVALSDRTVVYLDPQVTVEDGAVVIDGATDVAVLRDSLPAALQAVGVKNIRNRMRLLPEDGDLGGRRFGVCVAPMALTFDKPSETANVQTQLLYGEALLLLDRRDGYYLAHASDGYWGWVREDCVRAVDVEEFKRYTSPDRAVLHRDIELSDRRIVRGSSLPITSREGDAVTLMHPDGTTFQVPAADVRVVDHSPEAAERVRKALSLLYSPYIFGAISPIGMDCSGMVRNVCGQTGLAMARDAAQQFLHGRLVATRWHTDGICAGDILYFIDATGKIFHTGIAISPTHFVHCSPPEVQISSLAKGDRLYLEHYAKAFFAAKRP
jgi:hypothetical protein